MGSPKQWIRIAHILRPQGRKGEVLADLYTDSPERFSRQPLVWLAVAGFADQAKSTEHSNPRPGVDDPQPAEIIGHWLPVGRNAGRVVLHFAGVTSIGDAEKLAGKEVLIRASERAALDDGSVYVSDLVGSSLWDKSSPVGVIREVLFPATPDGTRRLEQAAPILSVQSAEGEELLIPFASAYLLEVDLPSRCVRMALPEGLLEINRNSAGGGSGFEGERR